MASVYYILLPTSFSPCGKSSLYFCWAPARGLLWLQSLSCNSLLISNKPIIFFNGEIRLPVNVSVVKLKEINCSVLGNVVDTEASECEEPFFSDEILSYADKYMGGSKTKGGKMGKFGATKSGLKTAGAKSGERGMAASQKKLPADITKEQKDVIQKLAQDTFKVLGCAGVSRIDFLIDEDDGSIYVNEINTIPGALSYYLWEATGKTVTQEMEELINIAIKRETDREKLTFSYDQNILAMQGGTKGSKGVKGSK